jgi:hypothetical protein
MLVPMMPITKTMIAIVIMKVIIMKMMAKTTMMMEMTTGIKTTKMMVAVI